MNYTKIYESLISRAKNRNLEIFTEKHHIIPRCLGGTDDYNNLVKLTPEEHYVAHQLLVKIYPGNSKLILAVIRMSGPGGIHGRGTNKLYGWLRKRFSDSKKGGPGHPRSPEAREKMKRNHKGMIGKHHSEETKEKIREKRKTQTPTFLGKTHTEETKRKISEKKLGFKHTDESKEKMKRIVSEETRTKLRNSQKIRRSQESVEPGNPIH